MTPFFVTRQVFCGAGRVGIGTDGRTHGFQITQRADFFEVEVGLETTLKRPIINTRDEPHSDPEKYRRLHVIIGDANMSEISTYLKLGTTALVLAMIEDGFLSVDLSIEGPVAALRAVSHDPSLTHRITLRDGRKMTALQLQMEYLEQSRKYVEDRLGVDADDMTRDVLDRWESVLTRLSDDPMQLSTELDWVAKLSHPQRLPRSRRPGLGSAQAPARRPAVPRRARGSRSLQPPRSARQHADAAHRGRRRPAATRPPDDTRAYFRGRCLAKFGGDVAAASWDSVIFDLPGRDSLQRIPTLEPLRGTKAHVGELIDRCDTAAELVAALTGSHRTCRSPWSAHARAPPSKVMSAQRRRLRVMRPAAKKPGGHMAEKDSEGQQRANRRSSETDEVVDDTASRDLKERQEKLNDDVDSILDEIDEVLEENAEEFVRSYIQKGGQ